MFIHTGFYWCFLIFKPPSHQPDSVKFLQRRKIFLFPQMGSLLLRTEKKIQTRMLAGNHLILEKKIFLQVSKYSIISEVEELSRQLSCELILILRSYKKTISGKNCHLVFSYLNVMKMDLSEVTLFGQTLLIRKFLKI